MRWRSVMSLMLASQLCACALQPWVQPYERETLADPIMNFSRDPIADKHRQHVFQVREGARGAGITEGSGCGCN